MRLKTTVLATAFVIVAAGSYWAGAHAQKKTRYFELRTYVASPGKMDALHTRFREHTQKLFKKHGMENIGYWTPTAGDNADHTLVYLLGYPNAESREASWKGFTGDDAWKKAKADSEKDGKLTAKVASVFLTPTDYSPMR